MKKSIDRRYGGKYFKLKKYILLMGVLLIKREKRYKLKTFTIFLILSLVFAFLFIIFFIGQGCSASVCGNNLCEFNENSDNCPKDCGGFEGITKKQCEEAGGKWNECGSPCAGINADICIQVCRAQCECGGVAGWKCPPGYRCKLSGKIKDEIGVCVKV